MINIRALLTLGTKGTDKAKKEVTDVNKQLDQAADNAERMNRTLSQTRTGQTAMARAGVVQDYRTQRSITGTRGAEGRNFAGLAQGGGGEGFVAAYATLAANLFAVTAAFQALNNAAKTEQLTKGLELMGARSGVSLKLVSNNLREITDNAISAADSMRAVAQASSAGMSSAEIEKLGKVARGASLALGRDMSDSIDRLVRGVTKLEPELLDEIGIMVRLDDAVALYAKQNNVAVSSLTNLQRRQAFANAVLEEGERKFGAIADQIDSNPYDKLASAFRDLGTEIGKLANDILGPFIKLVTEVPVLGLVPALGVLSQTLAKVTPNLDSFYAKVEARRGRLQVRQDFVSGLIPEAEEQYMGAKRGSKDEQDALNEVNRLRAQELNLQARINVEARQAIIIGNFQENVRRRGLGYALQELSASQALLASEQKRLGVQAGITALTKARAVFTAVSGAAEFAMSALSRVLVVITLITAAVALAQAAFKYFFPPSEAEERLKKYKEEMKELLESAKETRNQLQYLSAGEGQDALVNSSLAIIDNLKKQKNEEKAIAEEKNKALTLSQREHDLVREVVKARESASLIQNRSQKIAADNLLATAESNLAASRGAKDFLVVFENLPKEAQILYTTLQDVLPEQAKIVRSAMEEGKSREYILDLLLKQEESLKKLQNFNATLSSSAKTIVEEWDKLKIKDLDTGFTKINASFQDMSKIISQLEKPFSIRTNTAIFDQLKAIGSDKLLSTLATAKDLGVKINPNDEAKIRAFVDNLKSIQELEIKIKTSTGMEKVFAQLELTAKKAFGIGIGAQVAEDYADAAQQAEDILVNNLINEKTAATTAAINSASLEIEKSRLEIARKITDAEMERVGVSIKEDSLIKDILNTSKALEDSVIARKKAQNDILALQKSQDSLVLQKNAATIGSNERKFIEAQITSNKTLIGIKTEQANLEAESAFALAKLSADNLNFKAQTLTLSKAENSLLMGGVAATAELVAAENLRLQAVKETLSFRKEELELTNSIARAQLATRKTTAEAAAARAGVSVDPETSRRLERETLQLSLNENADKKAFLEEEKNLLLQQARLEQEVFKVKMAGARLALENAIAEANLTNQRAIKAGEKAPISQSSISAAETAKSSIDTLIAESATNYTKEQQRIIDLHRLRVDLNNEERKQLEILLGSIPQNFTEVGNRIKAGLANSLGATIGGFGLTGQGADFYASERQGILSNTGLSAEQKKEELKLLKAQSFEIQQQQILVEGLQGVFNGLGDSITNAFVGAIEGSKNLAQAFGEMAQQILRDLAAMIIKMIVFKTIEMGLNLIPGIGPGLSAGFKALTGAAGGVIPMATGGVMDRSLGVQSVIKQPTYLVGEGRYNEAVVPLPNGRAIPVQMHGNSQSNNVAVTVNMTNNGSQTQTEGPDPNKMGQAIAAAVQRELIAQKAPGGLLNRYSTV